MELDAVGKAIVQYHLVPLVHQANLGLEVTMHRVDDHGHLATTCLLYTSDAADEL